MRPLQICEAGQNLSFFMLHLVSRRHNTHQALQGIKFIDHTGGKPARDRVGCCHVGQL